MLELDRMAIEEAGPNPERLAAAIHTQLQHTSGAVAVYEIAKALDIVEIREKPLKGLEGALVAMSDRNIGSILVNSLSSPKRRRFTLAHELGHFLNIWHRPEGPSERFACTKNDVGSSWQIPSRSASRHVVQETEASRFAIELLAPPRLIRPYLTGIPDLANVLSLSNALDLSREASARRYVELLEQPSALVFSAESVVRYVERHPDFPFVSCQVGQRLLMLPSPADETGLSPHVEADPRDWLARPGPDSPVVQTLTQRGGYAITLLAFDATEAECEDDE